MALRPWSKFYWADWRADPRLRMCSLAARGLWVELCGLAHEAEPYGHVLVAGRVPSPEQLASLVGAPLKAVLAALKELDAAEVFSRTDAGVIYSRRMVRDREREENDKANGRGGGNPHLKRGVNPPDKPADKAQSPEARSQNTPPLAGEKFDGVPNGVPNGWQCPRDVADQLSAATGLSGADIEREAAKFQAHCQAVGRVFVDISAGFRKWCLSDDGRGRSGEREPRKSAGNRRAGTVSRAEAARELIAELEAEDARRAFGVGERGHAGIGSTAFGDGADAGLDGPLRLSGPRPCGAEDGDAGLAGGAGAVPVLRGEGGLPSVVERPGSPQAPHAVRHSGQGRDPLAVLPRTVAHGESTSPPVVLRTAS